MCYSGGVWLDKKGSCLNNAHDRLIRLRAHNTARHEHDFRALCTCFHGLQDVYCATVIKGVYQ